MSERSNDWVRVGREHTCPICGKRDWCLVAVDGTAAICARTSEGSVKPCGSAGWLHRLRDRDDWRADYTRRFEVRRDVPTATLHQMGDLAGRFRRELDRGRLGRFAGRLGLSVESLDRLGIGWCREKQAWSFPMRTGDGQVCGIRLRTEAGAKFAVRGSKDGLFVPGGLDDPAVLLVTEGPTDCAALLDIGFPVVGRPSCRGGTGPLVRLVNRLRPVEVVVIADRDDPGQDGALALVQALVIHVRRVRVVTPPHWIKDARDWKLTGLTRDGLINEIMAAETHRVVVVARGVRHGR
jgi:hypothetical protein